jgi:hypothetical protein
MTDASEKVETLEPPAFLAEYKGSFLSPEGRTLDAMLRVSLELAAELWTVKERLRTLEQVLTDAELIPQNAVESRHVIPYTGDARRRRQEFVETIFRHLLLADADDPLAVRSAAPAEPEMHGTLAKESR